MKKIFLSLFLAFSLLAVRAGGVEPTDEGMWLPILLNKYNYDQMKKLGLKLKPEQIYDVNKGSLKDAVVWFGGGCTGEIISNSGLVLTNHHCGYDAVADLSSVEHNYLRDGFWAKSHGEEMPAKGLWVAIMTRMEDVTDKILPRVQGVADDVKAQRIKEFSDSVAKVAKNEGHEAMVRDFFKGNQYILIIYDRYNDIRLVGVPNESIGKFGGDTDNWMWPRQTGDFSMFRIYAGKDNKPAEYSTENVPYKPKHSLPVSVKGVNEGDYAMIMGFPGRTNRYETSFGIKLAVEQVNPSIVKLREKRLELMKMEMDKDMAVRLQLASRYAQIANYWKYFIGQTEQLKRLKVYETKQAEETKFREWVAAKPQYANILSNLNTAYANYMPISKHSTYMFEGIMGSGLMSFARAFSGLEKSLADGTYATSKDKIIAGIQARQEAFFELYNANVEQNILGMMLTYFYQDIPKDQHPAILATIIGMYPGDSPESAFAKYSQYVFSNTFLTSKEKLEEFYKNPSAEKLSNDPAYALAKAFADNYNTKYLPQIQAFQKALADEGNLYVKAIMEMNPGKSFYPDANGTLRLTYGTVKAYKPKDGVTYDYYTTLTGVAEKYVPGDQEFDVPARLLELQKNKDYGIYADKKTGELHTCFITDNDITGGNSGSPVMNGNGELIGLAFDGNWEAMSGDIVYDTRYKRTINVDIRYVLFLIDKYAGAKNIVDEMNLVTNAPPVKKK